MITESSYVQLYAHRGLSSLFIENSITAFEETIHYGVPGIELDIQWLADGTAAVWHDETIDRFFHTPESGRHILSELNRDELRGLIPKENIGHPGIPLFEEVLQVLDGRAHLDIEIKYHAPPSEEQLSQLHHMIQEYGIAEQTIVSSFDPRILLMWKKAHPSIPCGLIFDEESKEQIRGQADWNSVRHMVDFEKPLYTMREDIRVALGEDRTVICWTVDEPNMGEELLGEGVRGIISNTPQSYRTLLTRSSATNFPN